MNVEFQDPDHVVASAVGEPGSRLFFLQARQRGAVVTLKLEKQQVTALCEYLAGILADLPEPGPVRDPAPLVPIEPVVPTWTVGALAIAYEAATDRILLVAEELVAEDEESPPEAEAPEPRQARLHLTRQQAQALVAHGTAVVARGRPLCRLCGRPMGPGEHICPRNN